MREVSLMVQASTIRELTLFFRSRERRVSGSSTTKSVGSAGAPVTAPLLDGQDEPEGGPPAGMRIRRYFSAVGFDDRAADRRAEANALLLRGHEGLEQTGSEILSETGAGS